MSSMPNIRPLFPSLLALLLLAGCLAAPPEQERPPLELLVPGRTYRQVWVAAVRAFSKDYDISTIDQKHGFLKAAQPGWGLGQAVYLQIEPPSSGARSYRVRIWSTVDPRLQQDWARRSLEEIRGLLRLPGGPPPAPAPARPKPAPRGPLFKEGAGSPGD